MSLFNLAYSTYKNYAKNPEKLPKTCSDCRNLKERGNGKKLVALEIGERIIDQDGYILIKTGSGLKLEHRVVMEQMVGRPLRPGETVHHRNGIPSQNQPENLELWLTGHPNGIRATDITCPHCGVPYDVYSVNKKPGPSKSMLKPG